MHLHDAVIYAVSVMIMRIIMLMMAFMMMVISQAVQFRVDVLVLSHTVH
jgi:hypothetical protein